jgi:hypothetical protein
LIAQGHGAASGMIVIDVVEGWGCRRGVGRSGAGFFAAFCAAGVLV